MADRSARAIVAGLAVVLLALLLRLFLNDSGIPGVAFARQDEVHYVARVALFLQGDLDVRYFINPSLFLHLLWFATLACGGLLVLAGRYPSFDAFAAETSIDLYWITLSGRVLAVLAGVLAVLVLLRIGRRMYGRAVGLVAGCALAIDFVHAQRSVLAGNETLMVLLALLAFLALLRTVEAPSLGRHATTGLLLGLACSAKYNAAALLVPFLAGSAAILFRDRGAAPRPRAVRLLEGIAGLLFVPLGFLLGTPWALVHPGAFLADFRLQAGFLDTGFNPARWSERETGWLYYLVEFPAQNVGLPFALLCVAGLVLAAVDVLRRRRLDALLVLLAIVPVYLLLGSGVFFHMRFLLPAIPFILLLGARALVALATALRARLAPRAAHLVPPLLVLLVLVPPAVDHARRLREVHGERDPRAPLYEWVRQNVRPGTRLLVLDTAGLDLLPDPLRLDRLRQNATPATAARLDRVAEARVFGRPLQDLMRASSDLTDFLTRARAAGFRELLVTVPFGHLRLLQGLPALIRDPAYNACPWWEDFLRHLATLPRGPLVVDDDCSVALVLLQLS